MQKAVDNSIKNNVDYEFDHRVITADGEVRWIRERGRVVYNEDGKPVKMLGVAQDTTSKHKLIEDLAVTRSTMEGILHAAPVGIGLSIDRVVQFSNNNMCEITGYSKKRTGRTQC